MPGKLDGKKGRIAMPRVPSAVTVVTAAGEGEMGGVAIRSFTSVSIDPLLISLNVPCQAQTHDLIVGAERFAVHLLSEEQAVLSNHFSALDPRGQEPFAAIPYRLDAHGTPILEEVLAVFYCARYAVYEAGDHALLVGEVLHIEKGVEGRPLVYFDRSYCRVGDIVSSTTFAPVKRSSSETP